ncbi:hypothetical protein CE91St36_24900 [Christensenellaceae bacterium]|nr:hypothetical protein CE91St36_24900 [Christensenellaceae bacterium]BDF62336.1 hypothetical protein CE91St37_24860 [Christensenellaceae bacterium]
MSEKYAAIYKAIGKNVQRYRKEKGFTQETLAEKASISISYLTKIEAPNCDKSFSLEVLLDLSNALGIDVRSLLEDIYP